MKKRLIILLAAMLVLGGLIAGAAAEEEKDLFITSPFIEVKGKLKPVNLSCEDQGIRITVDSALARDDNLWVAFDLQDLEGSRIDTGYIGNKMYGSFIDYHMAINTRSGFSEGSGEGKDHGTIIRYVGSEQLSSMDTLSISVNRFPVVKEYNIPLLPFVEKYGEEEGVFVDKSSIHYNRLTSSLTMDKVLDYTRALDIPLSDDPEMKGVLLSGIGWIDGVLHIQVHFTENENLINEDYTILDRWTGALRKCYGDPGDYSKASDIHGFVIWDDDNDGAMNWADFTVNCQREDTKQMEKLFLNMTRVLEVLEGNWNFDIPLNQIRETEAERPRGTVYEYDFSEPLIEINHSCEDQGIRISATAGLLTDEELMMIYDLQDLEGHRIDRMLSYVMHDLMSYNLDIDTEKNTQMGGGGYSSSKDQGQVMRGFHYKKLNSDDTLTVSMSSFPIFARESIAVLPLLERDIQESEGCYVQKCRSWSSDVQGGAPENVKVLDYSQPLDIPLSDDPDMKDILLSGIGQIDGQVHIQLHYVGKDEKGKVLGDSAYTVWQCDLNKHEENGSYSGVGNYVTWDEDGDGVKDYVDYVIDCELHDPKLENYFLDLLYLREMLQGHWEMNIPFDEIRK